MFFGYIACIGLNPWLYLFSYTDIAITVNLNCLGYGGSVKLGQEKFRVQLSFSWGSPYPFISPNQLFLPLYWFQKWLLPSLPPYTSPHPSLSATSLHNWLICSWVRIRTRCMNTSPIWRRLSKYWFVSRVNFPFSTTDTEHTRRKQELIFSVSWCCPTHNSLSYLKPFTRAWQMLENLLLNTC